ncbi:hypothetical protein Hanom_Chr05g00474081 [Helianthus anomalus]
MFKTSVADPRIICWGVDEAFNHIFKGYGRVFLPKIYTKFFLRGAAAHLFQRVGPPLQDICGIR